MGTQLVITTGPVQSASVRRTKPRKLFRGIKRTMIRKALAKLRSIGNSDVRDLTRGAIMGFEPAVVVASDNSVIGRAWNKVLERLRECLDAKEGDE